MISFVHLKTNGEVCSNAGISDFNRLFSRNIVYKTRLFSLVRDKINGLELT